MNNKLNWINSEQEQPKENGLFLTYVTSSGLFVQVWKGCWETEYPVENQDKVTHWCEIDVPEEVNRTNDEITNKPIRKLDCPSAYSLAELFAELKFGRPVEGQKFLDSCITRLNGERILDFPNEHSLVRCLVALQDERPAEEVVLLNNFIDVIKTNKIIKNNISES